MTIDIEAFKRLLILLLTALLVVTLFITNTEESVSDTKTILEKIVFSVPT